jgi:hypothetical protein
LSLIQQRSAFCFLSLEIAPSASAAVQGNTRKCMAQVPQPLWGRFPLQARIDIISKR